MADDSTPSARKSELLERAYAYAGEHGLADVSLRPLASAIGSSSGVLLYLFGSKDGLVRAVLARSRDDQRDLVAHVRTPDGGLDVAAERLWVWLAAPERRPLLRLWAEGYARSLLDSKGPWGGFARDAVEDWLSLLADAQPARVRETAKGQAQRTLTLAVLRGALLDLLATGDDARTTAAVRTYLETLRLTPP
ncbi:TetR/AcrR family transcriptional regulator [Solicola gregarius]|uniref:TetR/AcrR family transcriptional regulator n=1 Tax=Solicola gregarius TaxID=2908642 RepID=A0AA46TLJ6_9ACTN|nr:TetR/AcrR family transcriptional regulator [Solicola gregarius]UYM07159.1 TetR/AcrR family transcriptional regulator [Solicola gregarius]